MHYVGSYVYRQRKITKVMSQSNDTKYTAQLDRAMATDSCTEMSVV
jgi:hypothetical protein